MLKTNSLPSQISWVGDNIIGHAIDPMTGLTDKTEGFGAFDNVLNIQNLGQRIIDVGGGAYDYNSAYAAHRYLVDCVVYDPFKRDPEHNRKVLEIAQNTPFHAALSISVLNVINDHKERINHIRFCQNAVKPGGKVVFKVWPGDHSGVGKITASGYQNNRCLKTYLNEITAVFGKQNIFIDQEEELVICINRIERFSSGSCYL